MRQAGKSGRAGYFSVLSSRVSRDFLRSEVPLCITPVLAALSSSEATSRSEVAASGFLPSLTNDR